LAAAAEHAFAQSSSTKSQQDVCQQGRQSARTCHRRRHRHRHILVPHAAISVAETEQKKCEQLKKQQHRHVAKG